MYIKYIKSGMYSQLYLSERLYLLYFHGKYYFKNRKLRKEYQYLHDVLNPYLYNKNKWVWVIFWGIVLHSGDIILLFQCIFFWMIKYIKFIVPFQWIKVMCDIFIIFNIIFSIVYYLFIMF